MFSLLTSQKSAAVLISQHQRLVDRLPGIQHEIGSAGIQESWGVGEK